MTTPITGHFILVNPRGLHLRPCARLIKIIRHYHLSIVHIKVGEKIADGQSILEMLMLGAPSGSDIVVEVNGGENPEEEFKLIGEELVNIDIISD